MSRYVDELYQSPGQPGLRAVLRGMLKLLFRGLIRPPVPFAVQALVLRLLTLGMPLASGVTRSVEQIAGRPCMWHRPAAGGNGRVLLYLHGGAFVIGSPQTHRGICSALASRGQFDVCALDYRLAPAHPAPAACDDAVAAYQALLQRGYAPAQITLIGDSAGGNLVLVTAQKLAALKLPLPATLVCFSPVTDMTAEQLHAPAAGDPLLHPSWLDSARDAYCPAGLDRADPMVSPLFGQLKGLPPLLLQVGENEVLLNDSLRLAEAARAADVAVRLERYEDLWHVFQAHAGLLHSADAALQRVVDFVNSAQTDSVS